MSLRSARSRPRAQVFATVALLGVVSLVVPLLAASCKKKDLVTPDACNALLASAASAVERANLEARSSARCDDDRDCLESPTARCTTGCGGHAVHARAAASFAVAVQKVDEGACRKWDVDGCEAIAPRSMPSCPSYVPRCQEHACQMVDRRAP